MCQFCLKSYYVPQSPLGDFVVHVTILKCFRSATVLGDFTAQYVLGDFVAHNSKFKLTALWNQRFVHSAANLSQMSNPLGKSVAASSCVSSCTPLITFHHPSPLSPPLDLLIRRNHHFQERPPCTNLNDDCKPCMNKKFARLQFEKLETARFQF